MTLSSPFQHALGSIAGRDHLMMSRGCQDAAWVEPGPGGLVIALADGCGSGPHSEVGARLGVRLVAGCVAREPRCPRQAFRRARCRLVAHLELLVADAGDDRSAMVRDHFLFTLLVGVVGPEQTGVYAIGDGVVCINGERRELGPFENDGPPYLGYELLDRPPPTQTVVEMPTRELRSLVLATDGASVLDNLADLPEDHRLFRNPDALRRRLARSNDRRLNIDWERRTVERAPATFRDDATVVVVRRSSSPLGGTE